MKTISMCKWAVLVMLACAVPGLAHSHAVEPAGEPQSESLFNLTDTWTTSDGKPFHLADLKGGPSVIAMIYTSCQEICPFIVEDMKKIERSLPPGQADRVHFAVFTFDPDRDTIKQLKDYARAHGIDSPRWVAARSTPDAVRRLAVALGVKYKKMASGDFAHSKLISVLDADGVVKYQQTDIGRPSKDAVRALQKMLR